MNARPVSALLLLTPLLVAWTGEEQVAGSVSFGGSTYAAQVDVVGTFGSRIDYVLHVPVAGTKARLRISLPLDQTNRPLGPSAIDVTAHWVERSPATGVAWFEADRPDGGQMSVRANGDGWRLLLDMDWVDPRRGAERSLALEATLHPPAPAEPRAPKPSARDDHGSASTGCDGDDGWDDDGWEDDDSWDDDGWDDSDSTGCEGDDLGDDSSDDWSDDSASTGCEGDDTDSGGWEGDDLDSSDGASCEGDDLGGEAVASTGRRRPSAQAARLFNQLPFLMVLIGVRLAVVRVRRRRRGR